MVFFTNIFYSIGFSDPKSGSFSKSIFCQLDSFVPNLSHGVLKAKQGRARGGKQDQEFILFRPA
jgi:hypothetical protein